MTAQEAAKMAPRGSQKTDRHPHFSVLAARSFQSPPWTPPRVIFGNLLHLLVDFRSLFGRFLVDFCLIFDSLFDRFLERILLLFSLFFSLSLYTNLHLHSSLLRGGLSNAGVGGGVNLSPREEGMDLRPVLYPTPPQPRGLVGFWEGNVVSHSRIKNGLRLEGVTSYALRP